MKDNIRIPGTRVKVKSLSHLHKGVIGTVDKDYDITIQIKLEPKFETHKHSYKSRVGYFDRKPEQSYKDYREGKFIMVRPEALIEIAKEKE